MRRVIIALTLSVAALVAAPLPVAQAADRPLTPREIYKAYAKSVVLVFATDGSARGSAGTGSIITDEGHVLTNAHVVAPKKRRAAKVFVYIKPDQLRGSTKFDLKDRRAATLIDLDHDLDLALLKIVDPPEDLVAIPFAESARVEVGEPVVAIGHPETGGLWTLTTGSISTIVADFQGIDGKDVFQTEASVNRGNSGGPLLNAYGQLVGVNTSISRKASDGLAITDINFSLKASVAKRWMEKRKLLRVAYASPRTLDARALAIAGVSGSSPAMVASADRPGEATSPARPSAAAEEPSGTVPVVQGGRVKRHVDEQGQTVMTVESETGETLLVVIEPNEGAPVAEDPEFARAVERAYVASRDAEVPSDDEKPRIEKKPAPRVEAKQLTPPRPYRMEALVEERLEEIRELEDLMDDAQEKIRKKTKTKKKETPGLGLW
jgi:serine protease Do